MIGERKTYKKRIIIICVLIIILLGLSVFGRYVLNRYNDFYTRTKEFYFRSDKLGEDNPIYQIENWSGIDDYNIVINMSSINNDLIATSYDIPYDISYSSSDNIICNLSKTSGVIYSSNNSDQFTLKLTPNTELNTGDKVSVEIKAKAKSPYQKVLSAKFTLVVGKEKLSYEIIDSSGNPYLDLNVTNTLSYYTVNQSFSTYSVGDKLIRDAYMSLSNENKQKCSSALVTVTFNPNDILLDMTDESYLHALNITNTTKNSYNYINGMTFKIDAMTSIKIRFYKIDKNQDYTYPKQNNSPIINLTSI